MKRNLPVFFCCLSAAAAVAGDLPEAVTEAHFEDLMTRSPFVRTLSLTDTFALRGIATISGEPVATLYHRETKKSLTITADGANEWGLKLVEVSPSQDLTGVAVRLALSDEEFELKYEAERIAPAPNQGGRRYEVKFDSRGRAIPPQELIDQYRSMNDKEREAYTKWREAFYKKHPELEHSEKRFPIVQKVIEAVKAGKEPPKP